MNLRRASRLYLPPTFALTILTGAPVVLADLAEGPGTHVAAADPSDAGADAGADSGTDGGVVESDPALCGAGDPHAGTAFIGAGCC